MATTKKKTATPPRRNWHEEAMGTAYANGDRDGKSAELLRTAEILAGRATEAMEQLAKTPLAPNENRQRAEWQLIERLRALHSVTRDDRGHLRLGIGETARLRLGGF